MDVKRICQNETQFKDETISELDKRIAYLRRLQNRVDRELQQPSLGLNRHAFTAHLGRHTKKALEELDLFESRGCATDPPRWST